MAIITALTPVSLGRPGLAPVSETPDPEVSRRGAEIYASKCSSCHDTGLSRAPARFNLTSMAPKSIYRALTVGAMQSMAVELSDTDKRNVAEFLAQKSLSESSTPPLMCAETESRFDFNSSPPFSGWGLTVGNSHAVSTTMSNLTRKNVGTLRLKWALAFSGSISARSQPTLGGGALYIGSSDGTVYALDLRIGCTRWLFQANADVRTGIVITPWRAGDRSARPRLYFGDLTGTVYALDAITGTLVWLQKADSHPNAVITASPALFHDQLFVAVSSLEEGSSATPNYACCTFRGSIIAFDARTGAKIWQTYTVDTPAERGVNNLGVKRFGPSGVAVWSTPTIDETRNRLYVATGNNYSGPSSRYSDSILALDLRSGRMLWSYQATGNDIWNMSCLSKGGANCLQEGGPDFDFAAATILLRATDGKDYLLAGQKSGIAYAFNPDGGALIWKLKIGSGGPGGGILFGIAADANTLYVPISDRSDDTLQIHVENPQPGVDAIDVRSGRIRWRAPSPNACSDRPLCISGYGSAITVTRDLVIAGSFDGHLRAFDTSTGTVSWDFDTVRDFKTVSGEMARGGAIGAAQAPIVYRDLLITNSGDGFSGLMPGNVLLVFSLH